MAPNLEHFFMGVTLNKKILVTGGKGFLGKHLIKHLQAKGYKSIEVADLPDYNLIRIEDVQRMYETTKPDIVLHLAAKVGGIGFNQENPASLFYENIMMGVQLLHEGYLRKIDKFVALGTICAYPKFTPVPFKEDDLWNGYPEETNAPYGLAKKMMLVQSQAYRRQYGFNSIFLLPVNLYGPGDNFSFRSSHVIPALIRKFHLAGLLAAGDMKAIVRDFQFNRENEFLIDGKKLLINKTSSPETIQKVLYHFGISLSQPETRILNFEHRTLNNKGRSSALADTEHLKLKTLAHGRVERRTSNLELRDSGNIEPRTSKIRGRTSNFSRGSSNIELRTSNVEHIPLVSVWGTGKATREFFYVENAAEAIVLAMEKYNKSEPINIGAGFEISIRDLVSLIVELTGYKGKVTWDKTKPDGQPRRMLDTKKARKEFGFKAKTGFREGLQKTIAWYEQNSLKV